MASISDWPADRIRTVRNGRVEPLILRAPVRSSATSVGWQGIILEEHHAEAEYVRPDLKTAAHLVHVFTGVPVRHEWRIDGQMHRVRSAQGGILILPEGLEGSVRAWRSRPANQWILELDPAYLQERIDESLGGARLELMPRLNVIDAQLLRLIETLHTDVVSGSPAGSLFGETIGAALGLHLAQHYSTRTARAAQPSGGLAEHSLNRVFEYIEANVGSDLHLKELADVAGLSTFHFAKLFKRSTSYSPHQYVLQRRLERAKQLLRNPRIPLSEVSLRAGFADQSHLSNVFRRFVGLTPSGFRALR